ncbi:MAG: hypothetical protein R2865_04320 [Deinococcales bacterium]
MDHVYWDILKLWHEIKEGLGFMRNYGEEAAASASTEFALFDSQRQLMSNPYHYRDKRNDGISGRR